jgi:hypothetical protein
MPSSPGFFNSGFSQSSTLEHLCTCTCIHPALYSSGTNAGVYPRNRQDEHVSPSQITLLKLLDSFLHPLPSFWGGDDDPRNLTGFLSSAFFSQAENVQRAIKQVIGASPSDQNNPSGVLGSGRTAQQTVHSDLDVRLPGVCVALILLSTNLSSILLTERDNREKEDTASTDPNLVRLTLPCHDTISGTGDSDGAGFIEVLVGMIVPLSGCSHCETGTYGVIIFGYRNSAPTRHISAARQFWEAQAIHCAFPNKGGSEWVHGFFWIYLRKTRPRETAWDPVS